MNPFNKLSKVVALSAATLVGSFAVVNTSTANVGLITTADLQGAWQISLVGFTGCGNHSMLATVSLNSTGKGTATIKSHGQRGDNNLTNQTFNITSLHANGTGTANLSCGSGCGWNFDIQVSPDRGMFNLVDADPVNPGNYLSGVAVHR